MAKKRVTKRVNKNNKVKILAAIVLILFCVIYLINRLNFIRPILWIIIVGLLTIVFTKSLKLSFRRAFLLGIMLFLASVVIDGIMVSIFKVIPAYTYNIIKSDKTIIYYSPGLKVWQCEENNYKDLIVDQFNSKGYACDATDLATIDSNSFLNSIVENYNEYYNRYVKVRGKISKKNGQISIEMKPYSQVDITVNGYVEFADNITLKIIFAENEPDLDNYDVYDEIIVVGLIKSLDQRDGQYVVIMDNSKIASYKTLDNYEISVNEQKKCKKDPVFVSTVAAKDIYSYCLDDIVVSFPEAKYELIDALSANKITIEDVYKNYTAKEQGPDGANYIYHLEGYSVLVCDESKSHDIFIGNKKMSFDDVTCNINVSE